MPERSTNPDHYQFSLRSLSAATVAMAVYFASLGGAFGEEIRAVSATITIIVVVVACVIVVQLVLFAVVILAFVGPAGLIYWLAMQLLATRHDRRDAHS